MNPGLNQLQPYPFERLGALKRGVEPPVDLAHIAMSIGEPRHPAPEFVIQRLTESLDHLSSYPATIGLPELRTAIAHWLTQRFQLKAGSVSADNQVLPVNGTREALFAFAQAVVDPTNSDLTDGRPLVAMPNPFYQIYEGAALLAGATPWFINCQDASGLPDFDAVPEHVWQRCQLIYLCTPGNPTGAVMPVASLKKLITLADQHDFVIAGDECYSEIYLDEDTPPPGLLQACAELGRDDYRRCVVFQSLSKRSNLPGLRSGFVAGDAEIIGKFLRYRTYHGCAMPVPTQLASIAAWSDELHVIENRRLYRKKFDAVLDVMGGCLNATRPDASFFLWAKTPIDDQAYAKQLFANQHVTVLPGSFLARPANYDFSNSSETATENPGQNRVRIALVAPLDECITAAERIVRFTHSLQGNTEC